MDSILETVKDSLGLNAEYYVFDKTIILYINMVLNTLTQLGVGPENGFSIRDASSQWSDFLGDSTDLEMVKTYICLKVRKLFDPAGLPSSASAAIDEQIKELEWRINVQVDPGKKEEV